MVTIYIVSAFSKNGTGGNRAGVVLNSHHLSRQKKQRIAAELGYSETAFVSESECADFKLEYFTPSDEVPLCGHATIGTFVVLKSLHRLEKSVYTIETKSGILEVRIDENGLIFMEQNAPEFYQILTAKELEGCFLVGSKELYSVTMPIQIVSTGLKDILLPMSDVETLEKMIPDFEMISKVSKEKKCVGIHAFSIVKDSEVTAVCRNFAPLYGITEESATGTSCCALACYLYQYGVKQNQYIFEQGRNLNSVSEIYVNIEQKDGIITGVYVGGDGYLVEKK